MLQHRVALRSIRFASQLTRSPTEDRLVKPTAANVGPCSILSRLSDRTQSRTPRDSDTGLKGSNVRAQDVTAAGPPRPRATSFVSARSAQKRDYAAEKWFTDVRELDIINNANRPNGLKSLSRKKRRFDSPRQHEMRPRTDLNALFATSSVRSATSSRIEAKKELGGDYISYLPEGCVDPYRLPVAYARLVLGRNKHVSLDAQAGALNVIEEVIRGKVTRQSMQVL